MRLIEKVKHRIDQPVAIAPLVTFRIIFGALMAFSTIRFIALGWIEDHFLEPKFHFKYYGFEWVEVLPGPMMYALYVLMIVAAIGVMLGWYYRISAIVLFLTFTYTELIDLTYYLNHYYFVSLVCGLLIIVPAHRYFSMDAFRKPNIQKQFTPAWTIDIFKFQLAIVYFYAGIAKINHDWLIKALPMKIWMPANDTLPLIGWMLALPVMPYVFSWLGMLYDCTIVFWLSNKKTRLWAYVSVIFFHAVTGMMFQIGVFPLVMIGSTLIFFSEAWHTRIIGYLKEVARGFVRVTTPQPVQPASTFSTNTVLKTILALYVIFQLVFPFRFILYPGDLFWTEQGYRFSWRVMLMEKAGTATFYVKDMRTGREGVVVNSEFLNAHQEKQMAMQPDMILQFAHFLKDYDAKQGLLDPQVRAEVYVTLNARPSELLVNPETNLAEIEDGWSNKPWIMPYRK